jgi:hypothetical protein
VYNVSVDFNHSLCLCRFVEGKDQVEESDIDAVKGVQSFEISTVVEFDKVTYACCWWCCCVEISRHLNFADSVGVGE